MTKRKSLLDKLKAIPAKVGKKASLLGLAAASFGYVGCSEMVNMGGFEDDRIEISGTLESNETDAGTRGEIRAYEKNQDGTYDLLAKTETGPRGRFYLSFPKSDYSSPVPLDLEFDLQARITDGNLPDGFVRTITLPQKDKDDVLVRAVPYTDLNGDASDRRRNITPEQFKEFVEETNYGSYGLIHHNHNVTESVEETNYGGSARKLDPPQVVEGKDTTGVIKWDLDEFKGVRIFCLDPASDAYFLSSDVHHIVSGLEHPAMRALVGGKKIHVETDCSPESEQLYSGDDKGWIIVTPTNDQRSSALSLTNGYVMERGHVKFNPRPWLDGGNHPLREYVISHEFAHSFIHQSGHTGLRDVKLDDDQSVNSYSRSNGGHRCIRPCPADIKMAEVVYEDTYPPGTLYKNILGLDFHNSKK